MERITAVLLFCTLCTTSQAQSAGSFHLPPYYHWLAFYDAPNSFGIYTSRDFTIREFKRPANENEQQKAKILIWSADIFAYRYPSNSDGLAVFPGIGYHYQHGRSYFTGLALHAGLLRNFYEGIVYARSPDGQIKELNLFGRFYAIAGFSYVASWKIGAEGGHWLTVSPMAWTQYPYNNLFKLHLSVTAGLSLPAKRTL